MKKLLLLGAMAFGAFLSAEAQTGASCADAIVLTNTSGTVTATSFNGAFAGYCLDGDTTTSARWYRYAATANGEVTISSNLPANNGTTYTNDTRVQVLRGTGTDCSALEVCVATGDDIAPSATPPNYLTTVTFPVAAGKTYWIQWDNYWNEGDTKGFRFTFNFTATGCIRPSQFDTYLPFNYTTTSAQLAWRKSVGNPANYNVDWSATMNAAPGTGTIVTAPAGTLEYATTLLTGLPASGNIRYYLRSNCGFTQSEWQGPFYAYLAKSASYSHLFNPATNGLDGFTGDFTYFAPAATSTLISYTDGSAGGSIYSFNSGTAATDDWGFTRAFSLTAGSVVTIKYKTRVYNGGASSAPLSLRLTVGMDAVDTEQTTVIQTVAPTGTAAFTQHTATWTVPTTGVYHFGLNNNSVMSNLSTAMFIDTFEVTFAPASAESFVASQLTVFPNPATNMVTVSAVDALVNGVELIDINGRTVKTVKLNGVAEAQINISDLSAGVYMMNISSDKGSATKKVVKQ